MACIVRGCNDGRKTALMCPAHWEKLPIDLRDSLRKGGGQSLRAVPTREWVQAASKHVGDVRNVQTLDASSKKKRNKPEDTDNV